MNLKCSFLFLPIFFLHPLTAQYLNQVHEFIGQNEFNLKNSERLDSLITSQLDHINSTELADTYHDIGLKWFFKKGWLRSMNKNDLRKSIHYFESALKLKRNIDGLESNSIKQSLYNLGYMFTEDGRYYEAIGAYQEIIEIPEYSKLTLAAYRELGKSYLIVNDFHNALDSFDQLIFLAQEDSNYVKGLVEGYYRRAETYALIDEQSYSQQIQSNLRKADSIWEAHSGTLNPVFKDEILQLEGNRLLALGQYSKAIQCFEEVQDRLPAQDTVNQAIVSNSIGSAYLLSDQYNKASIHFEIASKYNSIYSLPYENWGDAYLQQDSIDKAIVMYRHAVQLGAGLSSHDLKSEGLKSEDLQLSSDKYYLLSHLLAYAHALTQYYQAHQDTAHLHEALSIYLLSDQLVDIIRFESYEYKSKLYWREKSASLYLNAVEVCYLLGKPDQAYYFMEKNKAVLLLEDISNEQAKENSGIPLEVAARELELKQNIALKESQLLQAKSQFPDSVQNAKNEFYTSKRSHEKFVDSLKQAFPMYAIRKQKIDLLGYEYFKQEYLSEEQAVVHYILNNEKGFGLIHSAGEPYLFQIDSVGNLQSEINQITELIAEPFKTSSALRTYQTQSRTVFEALFPDSCYQLVKGKRLLIIPDQSLQKLSFETLNYSTSDQYLIQEVEIRYAYSVSHLYTNSNITRHAPNDFLGLPISFNNQSLPQLDKSEKEVLSLQAMSNGHAMLGHDAMKHNFLDTVNQFRIIHLSTHAKVGEDQNSWIAFYDDKLSLTEVYAIRNQAEMIVLSACNTSIGEIKVGEGVMSFARAFFYAGTSSVISSLWSTNDKSSQELILDFYKGINKGLDKAHALRKAKLNYIQTHAGVELSPFYWGGLILIGDNSAIQLSTTNHSYPFWINCLVLLVIVVTLIVAYKKLTVKR